MGVLLHWTFQASFAGPASAAEEIARRGIRPLLDALEYWPELRVGLSINGALLERLDVKAIGPLARFAAEGRVGVLLEPYAPPAPRWRESDSLDLQLAIPAALWSELGVKTFAGVYFPEPVLNARTESIGPLLLTPAAAVGTGPGTYTLPSSRLLTVCAEADANLGAGMRLPIRDFDGKCLLIRVGPGALFPEEHSPLQRRNTLVDGLKDARAEPGLLLSPAEFAAGAVSGGSPPEISPAEQNIPAALRILAERVDRLADAVAPLPERIKTMPKEIHNREHLLAAQKAFLAARSSELWNLRAGILPSRRAIVEHVVRAQVEIDTLMKPETDPTIGWVDYELRDFDGDGIDDVIADTQLLRLAFSAGTAGGLASFEYKARKADLTGAYHPDGNCESFVDGLLEIAADKIKPADLPGISARITPAQGDRAETLVTKHTKDLFGLRLLRSSGKQRWVKHYTLRAGIGAHLSNSTTGFSCEYWIEGDVPAPSASAVTRFVFLLPSATDSGASLRPLASAGGESQKVFPLAEPLVLKHGDVEGGLYGGRLIDGIENFVMDIRSAKPLSALGCYPLRYREREVECFGGFVLLFFVDAKRIYQDDKANTIFLSIR